MVAWAIAEYLHRKKPDLAEATRGAYANQAGHLVRIIGHVYVRTLRRVHVDAYIDQRIAEGVGVETRRKELLLLRCALQMARQLGAHAAEPPETLLPKLRTVYTPRERWLEFEEYEQVMQKLSSERRLQVLVACYSGARKGELQRMRWEDVDWKRGGIVVHQTKPKKTTRFVPLPEELRAALEAGRKQRGPLLASFNNLYRDVQRACEAAGVARFSLNDCRRTFASWMVQGGVPAFTVAKLMGHTSPAMVHRVYGRLSDDSLRQAADKMPGRKKRKGKKGS